MCLELVIKLSFRILRSLPFKFYVMLRHVQSNNDKKKLAGATRLAVVFWNAFFSVRRIMQTFSFCSDIYISIYYIQYSLWWRASTDGSPQCIANLNSLNRVLAVSMRSRRSLVAFIHLCHHFEKSVAV